MIRFKGFLGILTLAMAGQASAAAADQVCNLAVQVCPKSLEGTTISVPEDVIWLEPKLPVCPEQVQVQSGAKSPVPSLVLIIDNSGSMDGNDPQEQRFSQTRALLDSIRAVEPATQVGLVIFSRRLSFDHRENPFFRRAYPADTSQHDSYVPLTALNQVFPNGRTGLDTLKSLLANNSSGDLLHATRLPESRVNSRINNDPPGSPANGQGRYNVRDGTDISLGFDAAREAMKSATAAPENRYFVFLSDGEPSTLDDVRQNAKEWEFVKGAATPTTFTFFFSPDDDELDSLERMTANIRANGYSSSNPRSNLWGINLGSTSLLTVLRENVLNPIFSNRAATAASATLVSGGTTLSSSGLQDSSFIFPSRVPLSPTQTSVQLTYNYTYVDSGKTKTHQASYTLNIRRTAAGTPPPGVTTICRDAGDILLSHKGKQIEIVTADHENLDVKLVLPGGETCADCKVIIQPHANRNGKDTVIVALAPAGGTSYAGDFNREVSGSPAPDDGTLQHQATDSIVVVWTNPRNSLEVIRKAFPYRDVRTALVVENHNTVSRADNSVPMERRSQWVLVGSTTVRITPEGGSAGCCRLVPDLTADESVKYAGIKVTASRSFRVELKVYDNLGQYVNKLAFSVSQAEFNNLPRVGTTGNNRSLGVLWDNRTELGELAATGAYILRSTVTLNRVPGVAEDEVVETEHRLVGVVRDR